MGGRVPGYEKKKEEGSGGRSNFENGSWRPWFESFCPWWIDEESRGLLSARYGKEDRVYRGEDERVTVRVMEGWKVGDSG